MLTLFTMFCIHCKAQCVSIADFWTRWAWWEPTETTVTNLKKKKSCHIWQLQPWSFSFFSRASSQLCNTCLLLHDRTNSVYPILVLTSPEAHQNWIGQGLRPWRLDDLRIASIENVWHFRSGSAPQTGEAPRPLKNFSDSKQRLWVLTSYACY